MIKPLIGYHSKKRRKWPRVIIPVFIIFIAVVTTYLFNPDLYNLENYKIFPDKNKIEEIPELSKSSKIIHVNNTGDDISEIVDENNTQESREEKLTVFNEINENIDDNKEEQKPIINSEKNEEKEILSISSANVFGEKEYNEFDSNTIENEKNLFETENLRSISEKLEEEHKSKKDTLELIEDKYYIIVSSVNSKEAAEKQQKKFLAMSVKTEIIFVSSINKYRISLGSYSNFKEASAKSKAFLSRHPSYKTWIWKVSALHEQ